MLTKLLHTLGTETGRVFVIFDDPTVTGLRFGLQYCTGQTFASHSWLMQPGSGHSSCSVVQLMYIRVDVLHCRDDSADQPSVGWNRFDNHGRLASARSRKAHNR